MNRPFVLLLVATVLFAMSMSTNAATSSMSKSKTGSRTKSKSMSAAKTVSKTKSAANVVSKTKSKSAASPAAPAAPAAPTSAPSGGTNAYVINFSLDTTAAIANNAKDTIVTQLEKDLGGVVTVGTFAKQKFTVQSVSSTATVVNAAVTATGAQTKMSASGYTLASFKVTSLNVVAPVLPSAAVSVAWGWSLIAAVMSFCLVMVAMF